MYFEQETGRVLNNRRAMSSEEGDTAAVNILLAVVRRSCEAAQLSCQQVCKPDRRGVLPVWPRDLNAYRQSRLCTADRCHGRRATPERRWSNPIEQVQVAPHSPRCRDAAPILGFWRDARMAPCVAGESTLHCKPDS